MSDPCEAVVERVALGEPLAELADHAAGCARCRRVAALPTELGATHRDSDPGGGFTARMTAGAQHRIVVRRRRRVATALAAAVAVTALGAFAVTREPSDRQLAETPVQRDLPATDRDDQTDPWRETAPDEPDPAIDEDVRALVQLADTERSRKLSAPWRRIQRSVAPYRLVLEGVEP